jgi:hypothetical protein
MADVVVEVDVAALAHHRDPRSRQRRVHQLEIPRWRDPPSGTHAPELLAEKVVGSVIGKRELVQPADVHRRVARLERKPDRVLEADELHANTGVMSMNTW